MRIFSFLILFIAIQTVVPGQQNPYQIYHRSNWQAVNPAAFDRAFYLNNNPNNNPTMLFAGSTNWQWAGLEGAPRYHFISAEYAPYLRDPDLPPMRYGFQMALDETDIISKLHLGTNFTWRVKLNRRSKFLYIGANIEGVFNRIDVAGIRVANPSDPYIIPQDKGGFLRDRSGYLDATLGIFYRSMMGGTRGSKHDAFFCGFSLPQAITVGLNKSDSLGLTPAAFRNYYAMFGWFFDPGEEDTGIDFEPTVWIRSARNFQYYTLPFLKGSPLSVDFNLRAYLGPSGSKPQRFWVGAGIGTNTMLSGDLGYQWAPEDSNGQMFRLGLGFTYPLGKIVRLGPTFELTAAYALE